MFTFTGTWWRFSDYVVRDGFVRPAPGAVLEEYSVQDLLNPSQDEYPGDEWEEDEEAQAPVPKPRAPHIELMRIDPWAKDAEEQILSWVRRYGLLGLLPHLMDYLEFADGTQYFKTQSGEWQKVVGGDSLEQVIHVVNSGPRWPAVVHLHDLDGLAKHVGPADQILPEFFPEGLPDRGIPLPLTEEFWQYYGERLSDLRDVILGLRRVWAGLTVERNREVIAKGAGIETRPITKESKWVLDVVGITEDQYRRMVPEWRLAETLSDEEKDYLAERAIAWLKANATIYADMVPTKALSDKRKRIDKRAVLYSPAYRVGTLLGLVATLTWSDYTGAKTLGFCEYCHRPFASNRSNQKFCPGDPRCQRNGSQKGRRLRRKMEAAMKGSTASKGTSNNQD